MAFNIDEYGNITLFQGDSGTIVISGLNTDKNYTAYFAVQDFARNPVGEELSVNTNNSSTIIFELTGAFTDLLTIPKDESCATYYYGVKICSDNGFEDTLLIGSDEIGYQNTITVYPKKVEGIA